MTRPAYSRVRNALQLAQQLDREWTGKVTGGDPRCIPWLPFNAAEFTSMLAEAVAEADGDQFLEVGCGIGTRMLIAEAVFGLNARGIENVPAYAEQARQLGLEVELADAISWEGYGKFDIVWVNRPFRDRNAEIELERRIWAQMSPGAILIAANTETPPPPDWLIVLDDWEARRGAWKKPLPFTTAGWTPAGRSHAHGGARA